MYLSCSPDAIIQCQIQNPQFNNVLRITCHNYVSPFIWESQTRLCNMLLTVHRNATIFIWTSLAGKKRELWVKGLQWTRSYETRRSEFWNSWSSSMLSELHCVQLQTNIFGEILNFGNVNKVMAAVGLRKAAQKEGVQIIHLSNHQMQNCRVRNSWQRIIWNAHKYK